MSRDFFVRMTTAACPLLFLALAIAGCQGGPGYEGPPRGAVKGQVTLDGSPLAHGVINFIGGNRSASTVIQNGAYSLPEPKGPHLGTYKVEILGYDVPPGETEDDTGVGQKQIVPRQYNADTTLQAEIKAGENTHNFELVSK